MYKNTIDLHGTLLENLDQIFDSKIYNAKINNTPQIKFITGIGKIQNRIIDLCTNDYNLKYYIPMHNSGEIVIIINS